MQDRLKNKLIQHEVAPPASVWDKISARLDEEFVSSDASLAAKMDKASATPPAIAWDNIAAELDNNIPGKTIIKPARVIPLVYKRIAVAALVAGLIALSAVFLLNDKSYTVTNNTVAANNAITEDKDAMPSVSEREPSFSDTDATPSRTLIASNRTRGAAFASTIIKKNAVASEAPYLTYAELEMEPVPVQTVAALQPIEVEAPLIRDARGNVIMDLSVISKPNDPYITVTSPSGLQTRISSKFLHCLSYLNDNLPSSETNYEGQQWKTRFEEWRNKLLSEGAFVPAANNFFDIFELKALIEER